MKTHRIVFRLLVLVVSLGTSLGLVEAFARAFGKAPWAFSARFPNEPTTHDADSLLGWKNKPGTFVYPGYMRSAAPIRLTILPDGSRATGAASTNDRPTIALVGGSFFRGQAISDDETVGWKLQERLPEFQITNFGTGAYGTYQSLLLLERLFEQTPPPSLVLYGLIQGHLDRNVATWQWLKVLTKYSRRGFEGLPYVSLSASGELMRHPPAQWRPWPMAGSLATINALQNAYERSLVSRSRRVDSISGVHRVLSLLLMEMKDLCERHETGFAVVLLDPRVPQHLMNQLPPEVLQELRVLDCAVPLPDEMLVAGEGHPNGDVHTRWAECITEGIAP